MRRLAMAMVTGLLISSGAALAEEVTTVHEGRRLVAEATLAPGKTWSDNAVLLVHGTMAHKDQETVRAMRELLKERGLNTLAINLSLGLSDRRGPYDCSVPHKHRHVEALLDIGVWLRYLQEAGAQRVALMGHSRGAAQVAWYMFEKPKVDLLGPAVLLAPMTWDKDREAQRYQQRFGHGYEETLKQAQDMVKMAHGPDFLPEPVDFLTCPKAKVTAFAFMDYYINDLRKDTPSILAGIARPVLVIAADGDDVVPDLISKVRARNLAHVELTVLEGADHFFRDLAAEEAADAAAEFLKEHLKNPS